MAAGSIASWFDVSARAGDAWRSFRDACAAWAPAFLKSSLSADPYPVVVRWHSKGEPPVFEAGGQRGSGDIAALRSFARGRGSLISVTIVVPARECLVRELTVPGAALARMDDVLRFDIEANLPFRCRDLHHGWYLKESCGAGDANVIVHVMIKKELLAPLIDTVTQARLPLREIAVAGADGQLLPVNLLERSERRRAGAVRASTTLLAATAALAVILSLAAFVLTIINLNQGLAAAEEALQANAREAKAVRQGATAAEQTTAQLRQVRLRKRDAVSLVAIWEEVSRILPDGTWLTELKIDDGKVRIDGQSANASELIGALAQSKLFSNVAFASPVTRDQQRGFERFQILMAAGTSE